MAQQASGKSTTLEIKRGHAPSWRVERASTVFSDDDKGNGL
jgi:hypothetical protein